MVAAASSRAAVRAGAWPHRSCRSPLSLTQVAWPHQQEVFPHLKFRLGLVYCFNRTCGFVLCNAPTAAPAAEPNTKQPPLTAITFESALQSAMEARFSPNGASLVFVSHEQVRLLSAGWLHAV